MGPINAAGPDPADLSPPRIVDPAELGRRLSVGEWVVDLRTRTAFAAGHLPGALNFELSDNFVTYLGWLYDWGMPLTLIAETPQQVAEARRQMMRIGIDRITGAATGHPADLSDGAPLRSYPVSDFAGLAAALAADGTTITVLDARRDDERERGGVPGSLHIPVHRLRAHLDEVPDGEVWVYCGSGYRAAIAASLLARAGRRPVLVDGAFDDPESGAAAVGLHAEPARA
jgi:rhodanese-related sulfurtransferase